MARTLTIDGLSMFQVRLVKDPAGNVRVFAEYQLKSGTQVIQSKHVDVTHWLSAAHQSAVQAALASITQDVTTAELS